MFTLEIIHKIKPERPLKAAILDFDGTISLIREGWSQVMIPLFLEILRETPNRESEAELEHAVREFVELLTGKQTIYQCLRLVEEVEKRGGKSREAVEYKNEYHRRLSEHIGNRLEYLRSGGDPRKYLVPGSYELLNLLRKYGIAVYLASGTDEVFVREEAELLRITEFCNGGIYGARDDYKSFSKAKIIRRIIKEHRLDGPELVGFGDGYVEIENVHTVGGFAVGIASDETGGTGLDPWKRDRLIGAGADWIIPDYSGIGKIEQLLFQ